MGANVARRQQLIKRGQGLESSGLKEAELRVGGRVDFDHERADSKSPSNKKL